MNRWLNWEPNDASLGSATGYKPAKPATPPKKLGSAGFAGFVPPETHEVQAACGIFHTAQGCDGSFQARTPLPGNDAFPSSMPLHIPPGVRLVRYEPKPAPVAIDVASVVVDVQKFIEAELRELEARLCSPVQIRGGWGVYAILDRLSQVGVELEIESRDSKVRAKVPE